MAICRCLRGVGVVLVFTIRLTIFSILLLVPFLRVGFKYFCDRRIKRGIRSAPGCRNYVDLYIPAEAMAAQDGTAPKVPVVIAVMGGAWVIGHRAWNAQLGQRLMDAGILMVAVDYRNWPCGRVPSMVNDLDEGIAWVFKNVARYGGDPKNVVLTGQSAGAHLTAMLLLELSMARAKDEVNDLENGTSGKFRDAHAWSPIDLKAYVGVSGVYHLPLTQKRLDERWINSELLNLIVPGGDVERYSPALLLRSEAWCTLGRRPARHMPPILLFSGGKDQTVPPANSEVFADALLDSGIGASVQVGPGLAHAEVIIEGPMRGEDHQLLLLLPFLLGDAGSKACLNSIPKLKPMYPLCIINLASRIMPF